MKLQREINDMAVNSLLLNSEGVPCKGKMECFIHCYGCN